MLEAARTTAAARPAARERIQVEMVSANPTGPITVASARNGAYGDSVARLLEFAGHEVEREYYYNDAGAQMERFRASVEAIRRGEEPPEDGYQGEYIARARALDGDPVPPMLEQIEATLERFRVHFDTWALQSELEQRLAEFLPRLDTYEKDGALWARSSAYGDEDDRVLIRSPERAGRRRTGRPTSSTCVDKLERGFDRAIYVLGADHHGTRKWYAAIARMLGYDPERVEVLLYQLVHLTRGGEQTKMSKRRGDVVFLDEFMDEVGVDAARWYLVNARARPDDRDRRRPRGGEDAEEPGLLRPVRARADRRHPPECRDGAGVRRAPGGRSRAEERELVKRLADFPGSSPRRPSGAGRMRSRPTRSARRRLPPLLPRAPRARERRAGVPARARAGRRRSVVARCLDLVGVEAPERM